MSGRQNDWAQLTDQQAAGEPALSADHLFRLHGRAPLFTNAELSHREELSQQWHVASSFAAWRRLILHATALGPFFGYCS